MPDLHIDFWNTSMYSLKQQDIFWDMKETQIPVPVVYYFKISYMRASATASLENDQRAHNIIVLNRNPKKRLNNPKTAQLPTGQTLCYENTSTATNNTVGGEGGLRKSLFHVVGTRVNKPNLRP